jgi:hypothetical protein
MSPTYECGRMGMLPVLAGLVSAAERRAAVLRSAQDRQTLPHGKHVHLAGAVVLTPNGSTCACGRGMLPGCRADRDLFTPKSAGTGYGSAGRLFCRNRRDKHFRVVVLS